MTIKLVEPWQKPTHRFKRNGCTIYLVANGVIDVAHACNLSVTDIEVKNGDKWEFAK